MVQIWCYSQWHTGGAVTPTLHKHKCPQNPDAAVPPYVCMSVRMITKPYPEGRPLFPSDLRCHHGTGEPHHMPGSQLPVASAHTSKKQHVHMQGVQLPAMAHYHP